MGPMFFSGGRVFSKLPEIGHVVSFEYHGVSDPDKSENFSKLFALQPNLLDFTGLALGPPIGHSHMAELLRFRHPRLAA